MTAETGGEGLGEEAEEKERIVTYRREPGDPLTPEQIEQLKGLEGRPVDTSDIPEWTVEDFKRAVRGKFYRPVK